MMRRALSLQMRLIQSLRAGKSSERSRAKAGISTLELGRHSRRLQVPQFPPSLRRTPARSTCSSTGWPPHASTHFPTTLEFHLQHCESYFFSFLYKLSELGSSLP